MTAILGCIADDLTGATDLAGRLVAHGMRTVQAIGVPHDADPWPDGTEAVVVALKSRTLPAEEAVRQSLAAFEWLERAGCRQFYFKYCSTFDSTPRGNIGPVTDALLDATGSPFTITCPAFPATGRTVYQGHLFVGSAPLNESGMQHHPLTPMTDANLVRVLQPQTTRTVGLIGHATVAAGAAAIARECRALQEVGVGIAVVDAIDDRDLSAIAAGCAEMQLMAGASGLAHGVADVWRARGLASGADVSARLPPVGGSRVVIAGSCSPATRRQVAVMRERHPSLQLDPMALAADESGAVASAVAWAEPHLADEPVLIYSTAEPDAVRAVQDALGAERSAALIERVLAAIARELVDAGVRQLIVAGGETAGAVTAALGVRLLRIGREIDPGVPWTVSIPTHPAGPPIALALKSGNFGAPALFLDAWSRVQ
jgi:uncharacterized protein YgbK (DUF1537 family)